VGDSVARKKPRQKIHCGDGHSDTEEHTGKHTLRAAFSEGEGKARHYNGNEGEAASDGAGESLLQHANRVFPWGSALSENRSGEEKCETKCDER
jgi:hypothetical protein